MNNVFALTGITRARRARCGGEGFVELLEARRLLSTTTITPTGDLAGASSDTSATAVQRRVYLIGNSMTDGIRYIGFSTMLGRDGASVSEGRQTGPGYTQADNLNLKSGYWTSGIDPARPTNTNPWGNYQQAFANTWDALTLQYHDRRLLSDFRFSTSNQADVPMSVNFMKAVAPNSPGVQTFAYSRAARRTDIDDNGNPTGVTFNYSAEWTKQYVDSGAQINSNFITRSYAQQFMPLVRSAQANDSIAKNLNPIRLIPTGEAYYNIDQQIKAGKYSGTYMNSMTQMYSDRSHPSTTAAYVIALSFYSSITGVDPRGVAPPSSYIGSDSRLGDAKVQGLLQQAVYDALTYSGYAGFTTIPGGVPAPAPLGSISGTVFNDVNGNGFRDTGEGALSKWKVFLDNNKNGSQDSGEPSMNTDGSGNYRFANLAAGGYQVREVVQKRWTRTAPAAGYYDVTLTSGQNATALNFGNRRGAATATVSSKMSFKTADSSSEEGLVSWVTLDSPTDGSFDFVNQLV